MKNLNVKEVSKSNSLTDALGISEDRCRELIKIVMRAEVDTNSVSEAAEVISRSCNHPNELFFVSFVLGSKIEMMNAAKALFELSHK